MGAENFFSKNFLFLFPSVEKEKKKKKFIFYFSLLLQMNNCKAGTEVGTQVEGNTNTSTCVPEDSKKRRNWFLTINNYSESEVAILDSIDCKYIIWQKEVGDKCGTPHIHACIVFNSPVTWPKRQFPRARIEPVHKLPDCIKYCSKVETRVEGPFERGERPKGQGKRTDLEKVAKKIICGVPLNKIAKEDPGMYVRYHAGLKALKQEMVEHRNPDLPPCCVWLWGISGVGKTRIPTELFKDNHYIKDGTAWWEGYEQQHCIIIDDFDGKWPFRDFLRLTDRNKYTCHIKGTSAKVNSPFIFVSCEHPPNYFWENNELTQVTRRFKLILHLKCFNDFEFNKMLISKIVENEWLYRGAYEIKDNR